MASAWKSLLVILSSLFLVGGYRLPVLQLLFQDGANSDLPPASPEQWQWRVARGVGHKPPQLLPQEKRESGTFPGTTIGPPTMESFQEETTGFDLIEEETTQSGLTESPMSITATAHPFRKVSTHVAAIKDIFRFNTTSFQTPVTGALLVKNSTETVKSKEDGHLGTPGYTSLLHIVSETIVPQSPNASTIGPRRKSVLQGEVVRTASTQTLRATPGAPSMTTLWQSFVTAKPNFRPKGKDTTSSPTMRMTTVQVKTTSEEYHNGSTTMVGKCLLAVFLLALVAGIFMVLTAVLATQLWRQKRACKLKHNNHTEMVCISSLLAAEEAEAAGARGPQVKRVKVLAENGSETDNLTLNSFLPDH